LRGCKKIFFFEQNQKQLNLEQNPDGKSLEIIRNESFITKKNSGRERKTIFYVLPILVRRFYKNLSRQINITLVAILQIVLLGIVIILMYGRLGNDYYSIQNRIGLIIEYVFTVQVSLNRSVALFPKSRDLYYREKADGAYTTLPFYLSYLWAEIPIDIFAAVAFSTLVYLVCGFQLVVDKFFIYLFTIFVNVTIGESFGIIFLSLFKSTDNSLPFANVLLATMVFMNGLFTLNLPYALQIINYASSHRYATRLLTINEFEGLVITCTSSQLLSNGQCPYTNGEQILDLYNFTSESKWFDLGLMVALAIIYRIIGYFVLRFTHKKFAQ